jgi:NAD(P)-dependent dehydrogenase (short-subunit alcohol dehydrogenase family)
VITVSSLGYSRRGLDFENLMFESGGYTRARGYARSKLANLLFTLGLRRRFDGTQSLSVAAHPGGAPTSLGRRMDERWLWRASRSVLEWLSQKVVDASRPILRAATDPDAPNGALYGPGGRLGFRGAPKIVLPHPCALDAVAAERLWEISEQLTGVHFLPLNPNGDGHGRT